MLSSGSIWHQQQQLFRHQDTANPGVNSEMRLQESKVRRPFRGSHPPAPDTSGPQLLQVSWPRRCQTGATSSRLEKLDKRWLQRGQKIGLVSGTGGGTSYPPTPADDSHCETQLPAWHFLLIGLPTTPVSEAKVTPWQKSKSSLSYISEAGWWGGRPAPRWASATFGAVFTCN